MREDPIVKQIHKVRRKIARAAPRSLSGKPRRAIDRAHVPAAVRFLSVEPLLGTIDDLPLAGIHWVIVGGESGPHARPMQPRWVEDLLAQCRANRVPFFFKQWGGVQKHRTGRTLRGRVYDEMPRSP